MSDPLQCLLRLGLPEPKAKETLKNEALTEMLLDVLGTASSFGDVRPPVGNLLYYMATKLKPQIKPRTSLLIGYIMDGRIDTVPRLDAALEYLLTASADGSFDKADFESACGVGIVVSAEDIRNTVREEIEADEADIREKRYRFNLGPLMQRVRNRLKWADGRTVRSEVDAQVLDLLGPKTEADRAPQAKPQKRSALAGTATGEIDLSNVQKTTESLTIDEMISKLHLHAPGENYKTDGYIITSNTRSIIKKHLEITGGQVRTRFPPEPNGILHIGHAKAININFGYASYHKGLCFLRYDDTNPEKEEEKYFTGIREMVEWLGYKPYKVTHSSDYFDQLYDWAINLIKAGKAYICHQKKEEMQGVNPPPSPWRDRPVKDNLLLFDSMRKGKMDEGECTLRMKTTLEEGKQDPVAYRIKYIPHHRTRDKWCIYPTYDFTHCLCDSIEQITHSLCTKEFQSRRSSYYWLCNALDIYCPVQWEYGRLNMNYTVVSKRKIAKLIEKGIVNDWDDPRLFTLSALRRRGFPPEAINRFCARVGVTGAQSIVDPDMLEACARDVLNLMAPRTMVVLEPLEVRIVGGLPGEASVTVPDFPSDQDGPSHKVSLSGVIFIEKADFKAKPEQGYRRLTPDQPVGLRYANLLLRFIKEEMSQSGEVRVLAQVEPMTTDNRPKAFIHWVSKPVTVTVRLYNSLFKHKNPEDVNEVPEGYLSDITDNSLVVRKSFADKYILNSAMESIKNLAKYQFERLGYFSLDPDSSESNLVFNRTVLLKEDSRKT